MNPYRRFIVSSIKKKYSNSAVYDKKFLIYFFEFRNILAKNISKLKKKKSKDNKLLLDLKIIFKKRQIKKKDERKIIKLYKRFNINLKITYKKKKIDPKTYIYLASTVLRIKKINKLQKLNFLMKIIDNLSLEKKIYLESTEELLINKLLNFERLCIKKLKT